MDAIRFVNEKLRQDDSDSSNPMMIVDEEDLPTDFINRKKKNIVSMIEIFLR